MNTLKALTKMPKKTATDQVIKDTLLKQKNTTKPKYDLRNALIDELVKERRQRTVRAC